MGFLFRKSLGLGPFRLTLSKSGLSGSFGIKGFRIGVNTRGSWISVGAGGVSYRQFAAHGQNRITGKGGKAAAESLEKTINVPHGTVGVFVELRQKGIIDLTDVKSGAAGIHGE